MNVLLLVLRTKLIAQLLGPEGIGLLGLLSSLQEIAAQSADGGLSHSAVRQIAVAQKLRARLAHLRRALSWAVFAAAGAGGVAVWLLRVQLAVLLTGDPALAAEVGLIAIGVICTVLFRWQQSLLSAFRRVGDLAGTVVIGTALATVAGIAAVWLLGRDGIVWAVIAIPAASLLAAPFYTRCLPKPAEQPIRWARLLQAWRGLYRLGFGLMAVALLALLIPQILRVWLVHEEGLAEAGYFQAVWVIGAHVMTVLLTSVAMDFYPALSAVADDPVKSRDLIDRQCRVHLAFGGPVILGVIALAPILLMLLFAQAFVVAAALLQWQMLALLLRLIVVPAETLLTARARPWPLFAGQLAAQTALLPTALALYPAFGLVGIGVAFVLSGVLHLLILRRLLEAGVWSAEVLWQAAGLAALSLVLIGASTFWPLTTMFAGSLAALVALVPGIRMAAAALDQGHWLRRRVSSAFSALGWPIPAGAST